VTLIFIVEFETDRPKLRDVQVVVDVVNVEWSECFIFMTDWELFARSIIE
jgi:hypothetical protein